MRQTSLDISISTLQHTDSAAVAASRQQSRYSAITVKIDVEFFRFHSLFIRVTVIFPDICLSHLSHSIVFSKQDSVFQKEKKNPKSIESKNSRELEKLPKKSVWKKHIKKCAALCLRFLWFPLPTSAAKRLLLHLTLLQYLSPLLCGSVDASIALGEMCLVMRAWTQLDMARLLLLCFCLTDLHAFQLHTHDSALQPCREALTGCA